MKIITFILFLMSLKAFANSSELTLYFVPSPLGLDWSSPSTLAMTALKNKLSFKPRFIGHVFVELTCGGQHELTGMVGKNFDYLNQLLIEQKGLGILYHSFEGRLEDKADIQKELAEYFKSGHVNFLTLRISESQCARALKYLSEYREKNVGRYYGLANRPRFGEGSGCSAFGASFIDVLNLIDEDMRLSWSQTMNIPLAFSGRPLREENVNILSLMMNASSWAKEDEPHQKLTYWDPDKMHAWVKRKYETKAPNFSLAKKENSIGVVIDRSQVPVPEEPIWRQVLDPKNPKQVLLEPKKRLRGQKY